MATPTIPTSVRRLKAAIVAVALAIPALPSAVSAQTAGTPVSLAKTAVIDRSRDPTSVLFRDVRVTGRCGGVTYVQGSANGKNGFGGYSGFTIFLVRVERGAAEVMQAYGQLFTSDAAFTIAAACYAGG